MKHFFRYLDMFGEKINFNIGGKSSTYKTVRGSFVSIVILSLILIYGTQKFITMYRREATKFQSKIEKSAIPNEKVFTADELDFSIAFGLFDFKEDGSIYSNTD